MAIAVRKGRVTVIDPALMKLNVAYSIVIGKPDTCIVICKTATGRIEMARSQDCPETPKCGMS